jgi:uncharacterized protein YkwD
VPTAVLRLATPILAALVALSIAGPAAAAGLAAFDQPTLSQARADLASLVNSQRAAQGLVALQLDPRAMAIAQSRAETLAATDLLSHTGPDGRTVFDAIRASGINWYGAGEVLVWNNYPTEADSTAQAVTAWLGSPVHRSIILSTGYNYVGFGAAVSPASGNRYYAGVLLKASDETGAWTKTGASSVQVLDGNEARVTVTWTGADTRLQVLTAGLRDFEVQHRVVGGAWQSFGVTTRTSLVVAVARGKVHEFRVRARDKAGNRGAWSSVTVTT